MQNTGRVATLNEQHMCQDIINMRSNVYAKIIKQNWNQFLLVVKATTLKQQISKFYRQIQRTYASDHIYVSQWPVINVKASFCA